LPWAFAGLAFLAFALIETPETPAQAKKSKADPKASKEEKPKKEGKEGKEARPEPTIPKVVDVMDGSKGGVEQVLYINEQIARAWKDNKIQPAERCSDYTFIRRASLDIIGRIPTLPEIDRFMKDVRDNPAKSRSMLIERLLESDECAENLATIWTILLMTRTNSGEVYRQEMHDWLANRFRGKDFDPEEKKYAEVPVDWSKIAYELIAASGKSNRKAAVNFVLTHLGEENKDNPKQNGKYDMVPVTSRTTRLFLGIRTQCVQCHDHPFHDSLGQHHFWGINAFFRQVEASGRPLMLAKKKKAMVGVQQYDVTDNPNLNTKGIVPYERRNAVLLFTDPTFLDGRKIRKDSTHTRREELANFIIKSPNFSKALVNRMWGHFFGKSFTRDAVDDFGDHNPSSFPTVFDEDGKVKELGLLERLASDWSTKYNHNPKVLIRWICNSQAYGLKTTANKYNDTPEDEVFFPRMLLKPMTPEQLFESLMTATRPDLPEKWVKLSKEERRAQDDERKAKKSAWLSDLIVNFGNDEGEEGSFNGTVIQALMLMNGQDINAEIMSKEGSLSYALVAHGGNPAKVLDYLYKAALTRPPTQKELQDLTSAKMRLLPRFNPAMQNTPEAWRGYYEDVFWALLNSNEFFLNH
jgi:hypothetical protein